MAMTKKDYQLVATALCNQKESILNQSVDACKVVDDTTEILAAHFALMNDKFNKDTFLEAAGHGQGEEHE